MAWSLQVSEPLPEGLIVSRLHAKPVGFTAVLWQVSATEVCFELGWSAQHMQLKHFPGCKQAFRLQLMMSWSDPLIALCSTAVPEALRIILQRCFGYEPTERPSLSELIEVRYRWYSSKMSTASAQSGNEALGVGFGQTIFSQVCSFARKGALAFAG